MASIKYSGLIDSIKGKIAGTSFQLGYAGNIVKAKSKTRLATVPLLVLRHQYKKAFFTVVSQAWRAMSDVQRTNWNTASALFPATNRFGDTYTPSGYQIFIQFGIIAYGFNNTVSTATPVPITWPTLVGNVIYYLDPTQLKLQPAVTSTENIRMEVLATAQHSAGTMVGRGGFKFIGIYETSSEGLLNLTDDYKKVFRLPYIGQRVTIKWRWIDKVLGQASPWVLITNVSS